MTRMSTPLLALVVLAACGVPEDQQPTSTRTESETNAPPPRHDGAEPAPARSSLVPGELTSADRQQSRLDGELGCVFTVGSADTVLLFAATNVDDAAGADALVRIDGRVERIAMDGRGGFAALGGDPRFSGSGALNVAIERSSEEPVTEEPHIATESPRYPARLTVSRDGQEVAIEGFWECGP